MDIQLAVGAHPDRLTGTAKIAMKSHTPQANCHLGLCLHTCSRCSTEFDHLCRACEPHDSEAIVCADLLAFDGSINCTNCLEILLEKQRSEYEMIQLYEGASGRRNKLIEMFLELDRGRYGEVARLIGPILALEIRCEASLECEAAGLETWKQGDCETAFSYYTRAIELDPNNATAFLNRGNLQLELGNFESGIEDLERARDLDPGLPWQNAIIFRLAGPELREQWLKRFREKPRHEP